MLLPDVSRDGWLLFASCAVRSFAYGFFSVILGLYLDILGMSADVIGWIFTAALAGGAVMTTLITSVAAALAPVFTGVLLARVSWGLPFLLAGSLKIVYDLWIFALFRKVKPRKRTVQLNPVML